MQFYIYLQTLKFVKLYLRNNIAKQKFITYAGVGPQDDSAAQQRLMGFIFVHLGTIVKTKQDG